MYDSRIGAGHIQDEPRAFAAPESNYPKTTKQKQKPTLMRYAKQHSSQLKKLPVA